MTWWQKNPRRVETPVDKPHVDTEPPATDWPGLPHWHAGGTVAGLEDEVINLRYRIARIERQVRELQADVSAQSTRRQR